jgi:hypothetical protein
MSSNDDGRTLLETVAVAFWDFFYPRWPSIVLWTLVALLVYVIAARLFAPFTWEFLSAFLCLFVC